METQRQEILNQLPLHGWRTTPVPDHELEWWADEMWMLESLWSPTDTCAYVTFLVDPLIDHSRTRQRGEGVWAVLASPGKPSGWQSSSDSFTLSLGRGWKKDLPALLEHLGKLREHPRRLQ